MDKITEDVKRQYNTFPYPSIPVGSLHDEVLYSTNYEFVNYLCTRDYKSSKTIKILDAGCGTGYSTLKLAQQNPDAEIIALDISPNSLKMARERLETAGVYSERIKFIEADLLDMPEFATKFDYIVCTGVIHHTTSPDQALKNLVEHLKDEGLIYLMLYSEYGRFYLNQMRSLISLIKSDKDSLEEGMVIGKEIINSLSENNPIYISYKKAYEASIKLIGQEFAKSDAQFIDAYVNTHERTYNIDQMFELLDTNKLNFIRFQDEPSWDLNYLFKGNQLLINKTANLCQKEKYKLGEIIISERNFAFFVSKNLINFKQFTNEQLLQIQIKVSPLNKFETRDDDLLILNPLGTGFKFSDEFAQMYEVINQFESVNDIVKNFSKLFSLKLEETLEFIRVLEKEHLIFFIE